MADLDFVFCWMGPNLFTLLKLIKANQYSIRPRRYIKLSRRLQGRRSLYAILYR